MRILGIETSCDETAMAVIQITERKVKSDPPSLKLRKGYLPEQIKVLSNVVSSQVKLHAKYGGVVPALAAREHVKNIGHVFELALKKAGIKDFKKEIDLIAVTRGPGLGPTLLVGITFAKTLAWLHKVPLIGVNHMEGHIYSNWLSPITVENSKSETLNSKQILNSQTMSDLEISKEIFPALNLIVSGGHTELVLMKKHGQYKIIGETVDDAVGEAFDKVARLLGLGYPGGPEISRHAEEWKSEARNPKSKTNSKFKILNSKFPISFPRPMLNSKNYDFSYSGLKTSVLYKVRDLEKAGIKLTDDIINEICYEFQDAAVDVLIQKTMRAAKEYKVKSILLSGGVSANSHLRLNLKQATQKAGLKYFQPPLEYTGDNATMIAVVGYFNSIKKLPKKGVTMDANLGFK